MAGHMEIQHEVDQGSLQLSPPPQVEGKPGAGHAGGPLEIKQLELIPDFKMRLGLEIKNPRLAEGADHHVGGCILAGRRAGMRHVGYGQQQGVQPLLHLPNLLVHGGNTVPEGTHLLHDRAHILALLLADADLLGNGIALTLGLLHLGQEAAAIAIQRQYAIQIDMGGILQHQGLAYHGLLVTNAA